MKGQKSKLGEFGRFKHCSLSESLIWSIGSHSYLLIIGKIQIKVLLEYTHLIHMKLAKS